MNLHYFYQKLPSPNTKFLATVADETYSEEFSCDHEGRFFSQDGVEIPGSWFVSMGYLYWEQI